MTYLLSDSTGKVPEIVPVLASYHYVLNLMNSLGVRLGVTIGVAVAVVVMAGMVFLITPMHVFWKHASFLLLASAISTLSSFLSALLSASGRSSFGFIMASINWCKSLIT
jgi:hypothetical protein